MSDQATQTILKHFRPTNTSPPWLKAIAVVFAFIIASATFGLAIFGAVSSVASEISPPPACNCEAGLLIRRSAPGGTQAAHRPHEVEEPCSPAASNESRRVPV